MRTMRALAVAILALPAGGALLFACGSDTATDGSDAAPVNVGKDDGGGQDATTAQDATADALAHDATLSDSGDAGRYEPQYFAVNHVLSTGQSLSVGAYGTPILSTTQPYKNLMFEGGVLTNPDTPAPPFGALSPLVEGPAVETMSSALANLATKLAEERFLAGLPAPHDTHVLLLSAHGRSGTAYVGIKKGTQAYANGLAQATAGHALTADAGLSYVVRAVTSVHGESDDIAKNLGYEANLVEWQHDYETDVSAITGQKLPIPMLHTQMSSWTALNTGLLTSPVAMAQLSAHVNNPGKIVLVAPKYFLPYVADGVHLTNEGYRWMGEYYAKAYARIVYQGQAWEPLRPLSATQSGTKIRVVYKVPAPPLVLDTAAVTDPGHNGFEYTDDSGAPAKITAVTLDGPDAVLLTFDKAPTGPNKRVRYAYTGTTLAKGGPTTGPRGNLRDSDATPSRTMHALYNWAVHSETLVP
jgi:hypothetical protein